MKKDPYGLSEILRPSIESMGFELWGIEFHPNTKNAILRIYIDKEGGITIDDCELVSRQITGLLDVHDPINMPYTLEVSSPGLDRIFFDVEQFKAYPDHLVAFQLKSVINNRRKFNAVVEGVNEEEIVVTIVDDKNEATDEVLTIPVSNIDRARLVVVF
ncbi:ribosome maturation factor RimP [Ignatzschineria sp. RMDPL8A]|uniref:ribosome maturation factor RimP n=1 Tax=Ignatzschineria sp. RMDPL8A TaxID=2999236 RepID=UPI0016B01596|nr:ribosome maturation factor RimP [Ignatzschineria sp. RMDPL8A]MDG9729151.1 ribosome maturation factor RimP [Ignatzschineria sp. RMDPL8A]NLD09643.1 ribosome maturation factor RimP [Xanthomonadaceae bacterium]